MLSQHYFLGVLLPPEWMKNTHGPVYMSVCCTFQNRDAIVGNNCETVKSKDSHRCATMTLITLVHE